MIFGHCLSKSIRRYAIVCRENAGVDATHLSALVACGRTTLGNVLEPPEDDRLGALRGSSPQDKRIAALSLLPARLAVLDGVGPVVSRVQEQLLAPLGPRDRGEIIQILTEPVRLHHDPDMPLLGSRARAFGVPSSSGAVVKVLGYPPRI